MILRRATTALAAVVALAAALAAAPAAQAAAPTVTTGATSERHFSRATLDGTVDPSGQTLEECVFEYGGTTTYGKSVPCEEPNAAEVGSGAAPVGVHAKLGNLQPETLYHFRLSAKSAGGTTHGDDATFTTRAAPQLSVTVQPNAETVIPGAEAVFKVIVTNTGEDETFGPIKVRNFLPEGLAASSVRFDFIGIGNGKTSTGYNLASLCTSALECRFPGALSGVLGIESLKPGEKLVMADVFQAPAGAEGELADFGEVSGGGAARAEASDTIQAIAEPVFGHLGFGASIIDSAGDPYLQAGGHPYEFSTEFNFATVSCVNPNGEA